MAACRASNPSSRSHTQSRILTALGRVQNYPPRLPAVGPGRARALFARVLALIRAARSKAGAGVIVLRLGLATMPMLGLAGRPRAGGPGTKGLAHESAEGLVRHLLDGRGSETRRFASPLAEGLLLAEQWF